MNSKPLLIELFTEELPPKSLEKLSYEFRNLIYDSLSDDWMIEQPDLINPVGSEPDPPASLIFATPRRLAVRVNAVRSVGIEVREETPLMPAAIGLDASGEPTASLRKKLTAKGYSDKLTLSKSPDVDSTGEAKLIVKHDGKTDFVYYIGVTPGKTVDAATQNAINFAMSKLPIPKVMNYQLADGVTEANFVRPAHGLLAMHGSNVIAATTLGLTSSNITHGHRFQGANNIEIDDASRYEELLREFGKVEPVFAKRREMILTQLEAKAKSLGATLGALETYADLLDEVTSLVEWPTVYTCQFESEYLAVPQECLILTMKTNQKYFPLFDANGKLKNRFLIVSNMELEDASRIITGNERVVRPRLADARFFFETDKKTKLADRVPQLANVVYHNKLGTQGERVQRLVKLAGDIATMIGADKVSAERAALLAKADLPTLMVGEFPELQGIMGRYYALADGEAADVAAACEQHYMPRFAGDRLPDQGVPTAVALADKLETLAGLFGIGQIPTGDKDPFALRRHALGVIRILLEQKLNVSVNAFLNAAFGAMGSKASDAAANTALIEFVFDRLRGYLKDTGASTNEIESIVSQRPDRLAIVPAQLAAVKSFAALTESESLSAANKRVANILRKAEESKEVIGNVNASLMLDSEEKALHAALLNVTPTANKLFESGDFTGYLKSFAALKAPVDAFFDKVMVMAEDKSVRANRLALLRELRDAMNKVADLSKLAS
jgi:glycyl-tRNA synthetase beta chain